MLLYTDRWWAVSSISPSPVWTLYMLFIWLVSSCLLLTPLIMLQFFVSFGTSRTRSFMAFTSQHSLLLSCAPMLMQTGLGIPLIVALPPVITSYWVPLLSLGVARNMQSVVARSNTEAEYRALVNTTSELLWLCWLLTDMGAPQTTSTPIHGDNCSAIHIAHNDIFHERTKHIEIDCHFIRHHLQ
jgi:hypothetical protein